MRNFDEEYNYLPKEFAVYVASKIGYSHTVLLVILSWRKLKSYVHSRSCIDARIF